MSIHPLHGFYFPEKPTGVGRFGLGAPRYSMLAAARLMGAQRISLNRQGERLLPTRVPGELLLFADDVRGFDGCDAIPINNYFHFHMSTS
jgi:hypothetical protein